MEKSTAGKKQDDEVWQELCHNIMCSGNHPPTQLQWCSSASPLIFHFRVPNYYKINTTQIFNSSFFCERGWSLLCSTQMSELQNKISECRWHITTFQNTRHPKFISYWSLIVIPINLPTELIGKKTKTKHI